MVSRLLSRRARLVQVARTARLEAESATALALVLACLVAWRIGRQIAEGVNGVVRAADGFAAGDLSRRAVVHSGASDDQLSSLARGFNRMADTLAQREREADQLERLSDFLVAAASTEEATEIIAVNAAFALWF